MPPIGTAATPAPRYCCSTHNWGTESDPEFKGYHNGNSEPRGFGEEHWGEP